MVLAPEDLAREHADATEVGATKKDIGKTPWQIFWRRFRKDKVALAGFWIIIFLIFLTLMAPLIVKFGNHHPPGAEYIKPQYHAVTEDGIPHGPNGSFWLGVGGDYRDVFTRILYGLRVSLIVAFLATGMSLVIGVVLGLTAGFYGGKVDTLISRSMDILLSLPLLLILIGVSASCGGSGGCFYGIIRPGLGLIIVVIGFFGWPYIARIVRGQVLSLREKEFVEASRMLGARDRRIIFREILPNLLAPIIVYSTLLIPTNILLEAALSFLGVGIQQPQASLGAMISDSVETFNTQWWNFVFPGIFLLLIVLAFNLLGDGLRDAMEPGRAN
ncbi:MAG: ABC transporter permease [Actinomycetota bacterium]